MHALPFDVADVVSTINSPFISLFSDVVTFLLQGVVLGFGNFACGFKKQKPTGTGIPIFTWYNENVRG